MVTDMESDKKIILKVPELFLRGRKLNISFLLLLFHNLILKCLKLFKTNCNISFYHEKF